MRADESALICDLAETYGVFDIRSMSPITAAELSAGLGDDSRIMSKIAGRKGKSLTHVLMAAILDELRFLSWTKTEDAEKNKNRPKSVLDALVGENEEKSEAFYESFETPEDFEEARRKIIKGGG